MLSEAEYFKYLQMYSSLEEGSLNNCIPAAEHLHEFSIYNLCDLAYQ